MKELNLDPSLVSNTYAKQILRSLKSEAAKPSTSSSFVSNNPTTEESKRSKPPSSKTRSTTLKPRTKQSVKEKPRKKNFSPPTTTMTTLIKTMKAVEKRLRRRQQKNGNPTISEEKKFKILYSKGPAAFGSVKNLTNASQLSPKKFKIFLRSQSSHTKYGLFRKTYPRLKVIVNDINEIWSLDLAYVDKLAKYNRGVRYLLVAVDCLFRYLRVEPLKTKYAKETTEAFKKMIKTKQPKRVWVEKGTEFKGEFEKLCTKRKIIKYNTHSEKKISVCRKKHSIAEKYYLQAYQLATKEDFGHLLIDLNPKTLECLRYSSNIVPPSRTIFYLPSSKAVITSLENE